MNEATFEKAHVLTSDSQKRRCSSYLFFLAQQKERRTIKEGLFTVTNSKSNNSLTKAELMDLSEKGDPNLVKKVSNVLRKIPSQNEFWHDVKIKVENMVDEYGPATFWVTFSPGDYDDADLHSYLVKMNPDIEDVESLSTSQLISLDPVLACTYIQTKFDALLKFILSQAEPIGKVVHHFVRTEYQTRLLPHFHCLFWVEGAPIIGVDTDEEVLEFISKHICCKLPCANEDPLLHGLVDRFQRHKCNNYCMRKPKDGKGVPKCKFSFPRDPHNCPVLHSVLSSIISRQSGSYKKRLYDLTRTSAERFINDYNPILLKLWKGNMDCQYIGEDSNCLVEYICKYATKGPKSSITDELDLSHLSETSSEYGRLMSMTLRVLKSREMGAMEARNILLAEPPYKTDSSFQFLNTVFPHRRKRMLKTPKQLQSLSEDSTDLYNGDYISVWYPKRPQSMCQMSLYEFAKKYERTTGKEVEMLRNSGRLIELQDNHGYMKTRRQTEIIVYGPSYLDPVSNKEEFFYSHLLRHKPWVLESDLKGESSTFEQEYLTLAQENQSLVASVEKAMGRRHIIDMCSKIEDDIEKGKCAEDCQDDDSENLDCAGDMFDVVRKQTSIETEEQLQNAVSSLSPDQLNVYNQFVENVEHFYSHHRKTPDKCTCNSFQPLRMFISGFGGSGKSHLIRTLMGFQFVKSEVRKEPCHFLLGAPTGIASCNISGQTLHSIWSLPVEHSKKSEYKPLPSSTKCGLRANYSNACGHIIDEVSMIPNDMLMYIHFRMSEVTGCSEMFGGLPLLVFGDLLQLEPVNGKPPYEPLRPTKASKFTGGGAPVAIDLWKSFTYNELTTNHRQGGKENEQWRNILSHVRFGLLDNQDIDYLNEKLIDTTGCKSKDEYLNVFVSKFLECEDQGQNPLCLLPTRSMCYEFNKAVMARKGETPIQIFAQDRLFCRPSDKKRVLQKLSEMDVTETAGFEKHLEIANESRVMLRINDKRTPGLVNGARGRVLQIVTDPKDSNLVTQIIIKFDDLEEPQCIERKERCIQIFPYCFVYRRMFPLTVSYAITIHKSQSLSLDCVFADIGKEQFCSGMAYVALSRCKSLKGLHLLNFCPSEIKASTKACVEYRRLSKQPDIPFNKRSKGTKTERIWYYNQAQKKAVQHVLTEIRQEKNKRKVDCVKQSIEFTKKPRVDNDPNSTSLKTKKENKSTTKKSSLNPPPQKNRLSKKEVCPPQEQLAHPVPKKPPTIFPKKVCLPKKQTTKKQVCSPKEHQVPNPSIHVNKPHCQNEDFVKKSIESIKKPRVDDELISESQKKETKPPTKKSTFNAPTQEIRLLKKGVCPPKEHLVRPVPNKSSTIAPKKVRLPKKQTVKKPVCSSKEQVHVNRQNVENDVIITHHEPGHDFNYDPVRFDWQKIICDTFGWTLRRCSTPINVRSEFHVHHRRKPNKDTDIRGDGNCFYRTIAHIVTGDENVWRLIKETILNFMNDNIDILQMIFDQDTSRLYEITKHALKHSNHAAHDFIQFHSRDREYADDIVNEFTACMFKTPYYSYNPWMGWMSVTAVEAFHWKSEVWKYRHLLTNYTNSDLQPTQKCMYLFFVNNDHWEPTHMGLRSSTEE